MQHYPQFFHAMNEAVLDSLRLTNHLDAIKALQHLLPENAQLRFCNSVAQTAMQTKTERLVFPNVGTFNAKFIRVLENFRIPVR